ncbi:MAG: hypothetical protein V7609_796 [Verrucomicrobiota bacterium]
MKPAAQGIWRPIRCLLLVACAGGILAADNTWSNTFDLDFAYPGSWFSALPLNDAHTADVAPPAPLETNARAQLSMGHLVNGLLFSRPSRTWTLTPAQPEITSAWMTEQTAPAVTDSSAPYGPSAFGSPAFLSSPGSSSSLLPDAPAAAIGFWSSDFSGNWGNFGNWAGFAIPDGAGSIAHLDSHPLFSGAVTVTLDTSRTVGQLFIGDPLRGNSYTLAASGGSTLTFDNGGGTGLLNQAVATFGDTVSAPIIIGNVNYLSVRNDSTTRAFTLSGNISAGGFDKLIQFDGGVVNVTGVLSNGTTGNSLRVGIASGVVTLSGTNTYTGATTVLNGATGLINGNNSGATGSVSVVNSGTLGGTGTIGGSVAVGNGIITGGTATGTGTLHIGTLTLNQNVTFNGGESTSTYLANIIGNISDTLAIMGTLNISGSSHLDLVGTPDGFTVYTLATYLGRSGQFSSVDNMPANYTLVYGDNDLLLVPTAIPEPATWIGGALALGAIAFASRRRLRIKT